MSLPGKTAEFVDHLANKFDLNDNERPELKHWSGLGTAIGAICLRLDLLDVDQLDKLLETQENEGGLFGQIAIRLGYLTQEQVDALLEVQPGRAVSQSVQPHARSLVPVSIAVAIWAFAMGLGTFGGTFKSHDTPIASVALAEVTSDWAVTSGSLEIYITQFGAPVSGAFEDWTAQISFEENTEDGRHGDKQQHQKG